jgi:hypothetical protein
VHTFAPREPPARGPPRAGYVQYVAFGPSKDERLGGHAARWCTGRRAAQSCHAFPVFDIRPTWGARTHTGRNSHRSHRRRTSHNATPTHRRTRPQDQATTPVGGPVPTPRPTQCQKRPPLQTQPWLPCPLPLPEHTSQASPPLGSRSDGISRVLQLILPARKPKISLISKLYFSLSFLKLYYERPSAQVAEGGPRSPTWTAGTWRISALSDANVHKI